MSEALFLKTFNTKSVKYDAEGRKAYGTYESYVIVFLLIFINLSTKMVSGFVIYVKQNDYASSIGKRFQDKSDKDSDSCQKRADCHAHIKSREFQDCPYN